MRTAARTSAVLCIVLLYTFVSLCILFLPTGRAGKRALLARNTSFFSRLTLRVLSVRVIARGWQHHRSDGQNYLIASNHVSYLDILVIASLWPSVFVTSVELRQTFPLGMLAFFGGSIFVERRSPAGLKREIRDIARALLDGSTVVLFPEGTTSNGDTVRPFKNSLFTAALSTSTPVLPLCIRYRRMNGKRLHGGDRDAIYYYGDVTFAKHAPRLLALRSLHVECRALEPIETRTDQSRKDLAARCRDAVRAAYHAT